MKQEARPGDGLESPGFSRGEEVNPESPRHLVRIGRDARARRVLAEVGTRCRRVERVPFDVLLDRGRHHAGDRRAICQAPADLSG